MSLFESLNLSDGDDLLTTHPSVVLYGPPGLGKSTLMARLFPGVVDGPAVLYVLSAAEVIRPLASWFQENAAYARDTKMRTLYEENPAWSPSNTKSGPAYLDGTFGTPRKPRTPANGGIPLKIIPAASKDVMQGDCAMLRVYAIAGLVGNELLQNADAPIHGVVWDEMTVFIRRFQAEVAAARSEIFMIPFLFPELAGLEEPLLSVERTKIASAVKRNVYGIQQQVIERFFAWFCTIPQTTGSFFGSIHQRADHRFFTADDPAVKKNKKQVGDVKSLEGPEAPSERIRTLICSNASVVLGGRMVDGVRTWQTATSELSHAKFRAFGVPQSLSTEEVPWAFYRAGYQIPRPAGEPPEWV